MPSNVLRNGIGSYIEQFDEHVFSEEEVERIINLLTNVKSEINVSKEEHIQSLHDRYASQTICPKCGSKLVIREVKQGSRQGSQFLGCISFPRCRYTKELQKESKTNWKFDRLFA